MPPLKAYLGDSVYIEANTCGFTIYIDNGYGQQNVIYLEPEVVFSLLQFIKLYTEKE